MGLENLLVQTCSVYTRNTTVGKTGQAIEVFTKTYANVPCRSVHVGNNWGGYGGRIGAKATHLLYASPDFPMFDTTMRVLLSDGTWYDIEHADMKYDSNGKSHAEYETFASESPQSGA